MSEITPYAKELQIACLAVQRAALLTKALLAAVDKGHLSKSDATPVTIADFAAQALIIGAIHTAFPGDDFVGEEDSKALREDAELLERTWDLVSSIRLDDADSDALLYAPKTKDEMLHFIDLGAAGKCGRHGRAWALDPVDGTATFMRGQQYAVCLALIENGCQKVGVLGCPNLNLESGLVSEDIVDRDGLGLMLSAVTGQGASIRPIGRGALLPARKLDSTPQITDSRDLRFVDCARMNSSDYDLHGRVAAQLGAPWPARADLWSAQMRYIALAVGGCNVLIKVPRKKEYRSNIWDHAGGMLLVEELGFMVTDLEGDVVDCGLGRRLAGCYGMIVAPHSIHQRVLEVVKAERAKSNM